MSAQRSVAGRAALSVALMIGFYALALGIAAFLAWIPYAEWHYAHRLHPKLALLCLAGAFIIAQAIVPRPDRFQPPGPRLPEASQRRLFAELRRVASSTGQQMPSEVYLVPDVNAWVSQRGGVMGFGSRRVMGLGLPLLQVLSVAEMRAVLAHEFGHYHGGDVKVGPWVYKTREALVRTLQGLSGHSLLSKPFELYAALFFRITHAVSRHQELMADALAARVASPAALASGLKKVHGAALAFGRYWEQEVSPVLSAGFLPPLARGFGQLLDEPKIAERLREAVEEEARSGKSDPYDTHPSLQERIAALPRGAERRTPPADDPPAISLMDRVPELEKQLLATLAAADEVGRLQPVSWEDVGPKVLVPRWERFLKEHGAALAGVAPATLSSLDWQGVGRKVLQSLKRGGEEVLPAADYAVGAAVGLLLSRNGFAVEAPPGAPVSLVRDGARVDPFSLRATLAAGPDAAAAWQELCASTGIADHDLGAPA